LIFVLKRSRFFLQLLASSAVGWNQAFDVNVPAMISIASDRVTFDAASL